MSEKEKMFLVQCLLEDIRGNWAEKVIKRTLLAKRLCLELGGEFDKLANTCDQFLLSDYMDGRFFRDSFPEGYEEMDSLHGLPHTLDDKSDEFKEYVKEYITYPEYRFTDVE